MSQFKELVNNKSDKYVLMKQTVLHPNTTWKRYRINPTDVDEVVDHIWFSHGILSRPEGGTRYPQVASTACDLVIDALVELLNDNGIDPIVFHRIAVNLIPRQTKKFLPHPHSDHDFDYKHLIIYLNDADGDTVMYNSKKQIIARSSPKEDKVISFGKCLHSGYFPVEAVERIMLVATYS